MGLDAAIWFQFDNVNSLPALLIGRIIPGVEIELANKGDSPVGATHEVRIIDWNDRYYSPDYARGNWPILCAILLALLSSREVFRVWYGNDCEYVENIKHFTTLDLLKMCDFYARNGNRPFTDSTWRVEGISSIFEEPKP